MRALIPDSKKRLPFPDNHEIPLPNPNRVRLPLSELIRRTYINAHSTDRPSNPQSSILNLR
jgi:hypothetical protein